MQKLLKNKNTTHIVVTLLKKKLHIVIEKDIFVA